MCISFSDYKVCFPREKLTNLYQHVLYCFKTLYFCFLWLLMGCIAIVNFAYKTSQVTQKNLHTVSCKSIRPP